MLNSECWLRDVKTSRTPCWAIFSIHPHIPVRYSQWLGEDGGIVFTSHLSIWVCLIQGLEPHTCWRKLRNLYCAGVTGIMSITLTMIFSTFTLIRCLNRWQFVQITVWKCCLSATLVVVTRILSHPWNGSIFHSHPSLVEIIFGSDHTCYCSIIVTGDWQCLYFLSNISITLAYMMHTVFLHQVRDEIRLRMLYGREHCRHESLVR